ncbi:MAG: thymidylate synthase, partial [Methanothrix sp.]|nr:thymidylate synthase [Methanothrix sp.]
NIEIVTQRSRSGKETILAANVIKGAPCGSTWYVAKRMTGLETDQPDLRERISEAHHAYPCTASMEQDPEIKDTILHKAGYIIREAVEDAIRRAERAEPRDSGSFSGAARPRVGV